MPLGNESIFSGCCIYIYPAGLGKKRLSLFETQIVNHGGKLIKAPKRNLKATHIVVDDSVTQDIEKLKTDLTNEKYWCNERIKVVRTQWLSKCLKEKKLLDSREFEVCLSHDKNIMQYVNITNYLAQEGGSHSTTGSGKEAGDAEHPPVKKLKALITEEAVSSQKLSSTIGQCNQLIIGELQKLADAFRSSGDHWRGHGYDKAISAIKAYGKEITRFEDVASLPNIGSRMAAKIQEILEFGKLRKVDEICNNAKVKVVELFTKVWGVGPSTAESWYLQGYRTLEDLRTKANLTKQQKLGLKYFDEIQESMPREEVECIFAMVRDVALRIETSLKVMLVGSYRRGKEMCGDVDILISKDDSVAENVLTCIITHLRETGFITDDLVSMETNGKQKKYLGICRLPGENQRHRRLDIFLVPQSEFVPALMHYTGGALFNRSIRIWAAKKNMSLSEHSLMAGVVREGKNIVNEGHVIPTPTEESVFEHLGLQYRPPEERNHCI